MILIKRIMNSKSLKTFNSDHQYLETFSLTNIYWAFDIHKLLTYITVLDLII